CAIHNPSCFSRFLPVPIAIRRFYKPSLWIPQHFLLTNPNLHHGLLGGTAHISIYLLQLAMTLHVVLQNLTKGAVQAVRLTFSSPPSARLELTQTRPAVRA